jgi:hypothetical protein
MPAGHGMPAVYDQCTKDRTLLKPRVSMSPAADHVIGVFGRESLSPALASTHRAGFGPQTRVIETARGDAGKQLERIGLRVPWDESPPADAVLIVVTAPGRTAIVADLFARLGADAIVYAERRTCDRPTVERIVSLAPDIRIGEAAGSDA